MVDPVARVARDSPRPALARSLVRRVDRVRRAARRRRRLELRPASLPRRAVHRGRADRLAPRLLARRQRRDVRGRRCADPALGRRDGDAARARRGRGRAWRSCSRARSAARRPRTSAPPRAPSSSGRSRRRRITGSRTTCRRPPTCSCSAVPTAADGTAFDETAARIRSIATVHRLLTETEDRVDGGALLRSITAERAGAGRRSRRSRPRSTPRRPRSSASSPTSWSRTRSSTARRRSSCGSAAARRRACASTTAAAAIDARGRLRPRPRPADGRAGPRRPLRAARARRRRHARRGRLPDGAAMRVLDRRGRSADRARSRASACARSATSRSGPPPTASRRSSSREASPPDLYLFDIEMPNARRPRRLRRSSPARVCAGPVVVVTGVDDPSLIERSIASGVSAYLTKPVDTRELEAALELAAARHAEFEALEAEVDRAQQALEDRKLVERAKGLLMSALDLSEQDAFRRLQLTARERNLRLADVAAASSSSRACSNRSRSARASAPGRDANGCGGKRGVHVRRRERPWPPRDRFSAVDVRREEAMRTKAEPLLARTTRRAASLSMVSARGLARCPDRGWSCIDPVEPAALERLRRCLERTPPGRRPSSNDISARPWRRRNICWSSRRGGPIDRRLRAQLQATIDRAVLRVPLGASPRTSADCRPAGALRHGRLAARPRHTRRTTPRGLRRAFRPPRGVQRYVTGQAAIQHDLDPVFSSDLRHGEFAIALPAALPVLLLVFGLSAIVTLPLLFAAATIAADPGARFRRCARHGDGDLRAPTSSSSSAWRWRSTTRCSLSTGFARSSSAATTIEDAVVRTMATAGRSVVFSGSDGHARACAPALHTRAFVRSLGIGGFLIPLVSVAARHDSASGAAVALRPPWHRPSSTVIGRRRGRARVGALGFWHRLARCDHAPAAALSRRRDRRVLLLAARAGFRAPA